MHFSIIMAVFLLSLSARAMTAPNISANTLFLYQNSNFHQGDVDPSRVDQNPNGLDLQEAELQIYSDVDPYTRLNVLLSIAPEYTSDGVTVEKSWGIEPEEIYAESNVVSGMTFKVGKFKAALGKHNGLHSHAFPFVQAPLANALLLGDEGLNDAGASAALLLPASWFSEFTIQYLKGKGENAEFNSPSVNAGVGLVHWKNLIDLSEEMTLELGASYAQGENSFRQNTILTGADLTLKWRPAEGGLYRSVAWVTEYLGRQQEQSGVRDEKSEGVASWIQYQFAQRWSVLYRYDQLKTRDSFDPTHFPNDTWTRNSVALLYAPSEFSSFKLEADQRQGGLTSLSGETTEKTIYLQANLTIGAHPAHAF